MIFGNEGYEMYVIKADALIVNTREVRHMMEQYAEKFGEDFISFNYADFQTIGDKPAGLVYKEALEEALKKDEPTRIESHRYDTMDH